MKDITEIHLEVANFFPDARQTESESSAFFEVS